MFLKKSPLLASSTASLGDQYSWGFLASFEQRFNENGQHVLFPEKSEQKHIHKRKTASETS